MALDSKYMDANLLYNDNGDPTFTCLYLQWNSVAPKHSETSLVFDLQNSTPILNHY